LLLVHGGVLFIGAHECPSPDLVERAFVPLAGLTPDQEDQIVAVDPAPDGAALLRWNGRRGELVERALPPHLSCTERARAAAVILAAHLLDRETRAPETAAPLPEMPPPPAAAPPVVAVAAAPAPTAPPITRTELQLGLQGARAGTAMAPGGRVGLAHTDAGHQLRLEVGYTGSQRTPLAGAWATWTRTALVLGYARRQPLDQDTFVDVGLEALASRVHLGSQGFSRGETSTTFHPGLAAQARVGRRLTRRMATWAALGTTWWPRPQRVYLRDIREGTTLPRLELLVTLGVSWTIR
jgi:hypothetical protein